MIDRVERFILEKELFLKEDKLIVAISGGGDSVCLMHILLDLGYAFELAHCNFKLRDKESEGDKIFIQELAKKHNLILHIKEFDTKEYASKNKISIQMAARNLRYDWFKSLLVSENAKYILLGHHAQDAVETFFINLLRGSGIKGLLPILEKRINIVRPLINIHSSEIEDYLITKKIDYRNDSSNFSLKYLRNKIRHRVLPLLTSINPSIQKTILHEFKILEGVAEVYYQKIEEVKQELLHDEEGDIKINISKLLELSPLNNYLYELLNPYGFKTIDSIAQALRSQSGKQFFSKTHKLLIDRKYIFISKMDFNEDRLVLIKEETELIKTPIHLSFSITDNVELVQDLNIGKLDFSKLKFPLTLRKWRDGDKFMPLGMQRFKKLSDYFIDNKFSIFQKKRQWVLCSNKDIIWIVGDRIDNRYKLLPNTKKAYIAHSLN